MNDKQRGLIALLIVFLALLVMGVIEALLAATPGPPLQHETLQQEVQAALKYRDGVVILWERPGGKSQVFGNPKLLQEKFLPGSLLKLITAQAALNQGLDPALTCDGRIDERGHREYCWTPKGHGHLRLVQALSQSCNLYFYQLARRLGWPALAKEFQQWDLPLPQDFTPQESDLGRAAIGEATELSFSPKQVASFWESLLAKASDPKLKNLFFALEQASQSGTAKGLSSLGFPIWAKTGTADSQSEAYKTHGWILAAAPAPKPRWALLIFIKNAHGYGAPTALAGKILAQLPKLKSQEELP